MPPDEVTRCGKSPPTESRSGETVKIAVQPFARGTHPHMDNFLDCVRSRKAPNLDADTGYRAMAAIGMGVTAYRRNEVLFFDSKRERVSDTL